MKVYIKHSSFFVCLFLSDVTKANKKIKKIKLSAIDVI